MKRIINVLSLGAGVQSSTLALMSDKDEIKINDKIIKFDCAIFADTQAEPKSVYKWLSWLKDQLTYPVYEVTQGNLEYDQLETKIHKITGENYSKSIIPLFTKNEDTGSKGMLRRSCTRDYKIYPVSRFIKTFYNLKDYRKIKYSIIDESIGYKKGNIKSDVTYPEIQIQRHLGISLDESSRMKDSTDKWAVNIYPLIEMNMTRDDCFEWMSDNNYPIPPRSACYFCPYHSDNEWIRLRDKEPDEFQRAIDWEKKIQNNNSLKDKPFLHSSRVNLEDVIFNEEENDKHFNNECFGMCGN